LYLLNELKRRNVLRVGAAYVVVAWLLIQVTETIFPLFGFDDTPARIVVIVLAIGFSPALIFAWAFEMTPEGLKKESEVDRTQSLTPHTGKKLDRTILVVLALALTYFAFDKFVLDPVRDANELATAIHEAHQEGRSEALVDSYGDNSIAVLPFVNMSSDPEQEYFSDGISEELLNLLSRIPELRVISRSSAFSYKGKDFKAAEVGRELNVTHILEGSVRKAGNQIRVTAQLIEARSNTHLWSETYDRTLDNIFQIQDDISGAVVAGLKITLMGAIPEIQKTDPEVHTLYLQGKYFMNLHGKENYAKAVSAFKQALAIDPDYARAWTGLSWAYEYQTRDRVWTKAQGVTLAMEAAEKALAIDDTFALGWSTLSYLKKKYEWDWQGAKVAADRALQLEPNNIDVLLGTGSVASTFGQLDKSIELFERAVKLDPLGLVGLGSLAARYRVAGRYDDALKKFRQALVLSPETYWAQRGIIETYLQQSKPERALAEIDKLPDHPSLHPLKAKIYFTLGKDMESLAMTNEYLKTSARDRPMLMASIYAWRGENDSAFQWLETAYEQRASGLSNILLWEHYTILETDPRYPVFLEKMGLLEAWEAMPPK
jgi:adenylate cyclase